MDKFNGLVSNITTIANCSITIDGNAVINAHSYTGTLPVILRNISGLPMGKPRTLNNMIDTFNGKHVVCTVVSIQQTPGAKNLAPLVTIDMALDHEKTHSALPPVHNPAQGGSVTLGGGFNGNLPAGWINSHNGICPPGYTLKNLPGTNYMCCQVN